MFLTSAIRYLKNTILAKCQEACKILFDTHSMVRGGKYPVLRYRSPLLNLPTDNIVRVVVAAGDG